MSDLDKRIYDADQARLVLENPAFSQAFEDVKQEIIESWKNAPARDKEGREELFKLLKMAEKLEQILRQSMESGQLAKVEIRHKESLMERAKATMGWN